MDFEIDYGTLRPAPPPADKVPLYASVGGRVSSLSNDEVVFYDPASDQAHVMTQQVLQAMDLSRVFRSLDEHAAEIVKALPQLKGQQTAVKRVLEGLAGRGLLIEGKALVARFDATERPALAPFAGFHVRACNRPEQLRRLLDSALERERTHGGCHTVTVIDDSTDAANEREHARLLEDYGKAAGVTVRHVGSADWAAIVARLERELPTHAPALRRMLSRDPDYSGRRGGGTGKNLLTLMTAGKRYALLDDDFLFPLRRHPDYAPGVSFDQSAWAARTYATPEQALEAGNTVEGDWMARQLELCGASLGAIINRSDGMNLGPAELRTLVPSRMPHLDPDARVLSTVNGHRGDSGTSGMGWMYLLDAAARAGFTATRSDYLAALQRPAVWHGPRRYQVLRGANFTPFMVDNSRPMPCTSPFGRSEDALYAALGSAWWANGVVLGTPFSIGHLQEGTRDRAEALARPETPDVNLCIAELVRHVAADLQGTDPASRSAVLVAHLRDLADAGQGALVAYLREYLAYLRGGIVQALQQSLAAAKDAPVYWIADLRRLVELNGRALADPAPPRYAGWPEGIDEAGCVAAFRAELTALADGLEAWPAAWALARDKGAGWLRAR